jgi:hypothetical protein
MERRNFLKKLFGGVAAVTAASVVPLVAKDKEETWAIDELFERCDGNSNLYFIRANSWLNKELIDVMGEQYVDQRYFSWYLPLHNLYLPVKERYEKRDFDIIKDYLRHHEYEHFCSGECKGNDIGVMRIVKERNGKYYTIDLYGARNPKLEEGITFKYEYEEIDSDDKIEGEIRQDENN